jgi:hypothetical protein
MPRLKYSLFFSVIPLCVTIAYALTNGAPIIDSLGQYDDNITNPVSILDKVSGTNKLGFNLPYCTFYDSKYDRLYVCDGENNRVLVYNMSAGNFVDRIPDFVLGQNNFYENFGATTTASSLIRPRSIAFDITNDLLFVSNGNRVSVFNVTTITNGEVATNVLGQTDFTTNDFTTTSANYFGGEVKGIAYQTSTNRLFVAVASSRVLVFDTASITNGESAINVLGQPDFTSSTPLTTQTGMYTPQSVVVYGNKLFVSDQHRVTVYDIATITNGEPAENVLG